MTQVLDGLTVLDLSQGIAGPLTTMLMSDYGAEVIKIEPPEGDPFRSTNAYLAWNRGKKSVVLDLKSPADLEQFLDLTTHADVLVESFAPGTTTRLGIDFERLSRLNERLVYCSISAYGQHGAWRDRPGYDGLVQARTGMQWEQPGWREGPIFLHLPLPSMGAFFLASCGINAALHVREVTGVGQRVETSLLQGVLAWTTMLWYRAEQGGPSGVGSGFGFVDFLPTPCYEAGDGKWFHPMPHGIPAALEALGLPPSAIRGSATGTREERQEYLQSVRAVYLHWPRERWVPFMWERDVSCQPVLPVNETFTNPQVLANGLLDELEMADLGTVRQFAHPYRLERHSSKIQGPPPGIGEHTREVLGSLEARDPVARTDGAAGTQPLATPLEGIRVLDLGVFVAGPYGAMILAELGADVIKIEPVQAVGRLGGAGAALPMALNPACNRGKRCLSLDLKTDAGREILHKLIESADVLHYNMRPGVAERLGFDYETARRINPRLIYCHTTGYGTEGPYGDYPGVDQMAQALCGIEHEQGATPAGGKPTWYRFGHCDASNGFLSAIAVLQALYHRDQTGEGQFVETSILNAGTLLASDAVMLSNGELMARPHLDKEQTGFGPLYRLYQTASGWICIACVTDEHWNALCGVLQTAGALQQPQFATPAGRAKNAASLTAILVEVFTSRTASEWFHVLDAAGVPCEVADPSFGSSWYDNPVMLDNDLVATYDSPAFGRLDQYGRLIGFSSTPGKTWGPPPMVGEHTADILHELGYDSERIDQLAEAGAVRIWRPST